MTAHQVTISCPEELLISLKKTLAEFESEARLLLAVKLYELGQITTGMAAQLAGMSRVAFMFALGRYGLSPIGVEPDELGADLANA